MENGFDEGQLKKGNMGMIFGGSLILSLVISFVLVLFLGRDLVQWQDYFGLPLQWELLIYLNESQ
nr:hypothetical protein [Paenisporosarcina sp. OV554]